MISKITHKVNSIFLKRPFFFFPFFAKNSFSFYTSDPGPIPGPPLTPATAEEEEAAVETF